MRNADRTVTLGLDEARRILVPGALFALVLVAAGCGSERDGAAEPPTEATLGRTTATVATQRFIPRTL